MVALPLVLAGFALLCWSLRYLSIPSHPDWGHYVWIAFVTEVIVVCFWLYRWVLAVTSYNLRFVSYVERAPVGAEKFFVPLLEEVVKFFSIVLFVFLGNSSHDCRVSYVYTVAAVYAFNFVVASLVEFCPINYTSRFGKFLADYEIYHSHILGTVIKNASHDSSLLSTPTLAPANHAPIPVFNLNSFGSDLNSFGTKPLASSALMPIMNQQVLEANSDMIERLYSVSPKNTLHFLLGDYGTNTSGPVLQMPAEEDDAKSVHSLDTHLGGGGGGGFKYKFPGGPKIGFGGGGGFDYEHGSGPSDTNSGKDSCKSVVSFSDKRPEFHCLSGSPAFGLSDSSNTSVSIPPCNRHPVKFESLCQHQALQWRILYWFRWLVPIAPCEDEIVNVSRRALRFSIRKKFSTYTLNSDTRSFKSFPQRLYGAVDLESQLPDRQCRPSNINTENVHRYYEFAKFGNQFFGVWSPRLFEFYKGVDPAFYRFGTMLTKLPVFYFIVYAASICVWQFSSTLILAYPFVAPTASLSTFVGLVAVVFVAKVFCMNYLHNQATCSYRVSLVVELAVNLILFAFSYFFYLSL